MRSGRSPQKYGLLIFGVICLAYLLVAFHRVSPAILAQDIMAETGVGASGMGALTSVFFVTFGLLQLPGGLLADSLGPRKTLPIFLATAGIGGIVFALGGSFGTLAFGRALMGIGVSVIFVCGLKILAFWFPPDLYARLNGVFLGMGGIGMILGAGPLAHLNQTLGWRSGMFGCGAFSILVAMLIWLIVRDRPEQLGFPGIGPVSAAGRPPIPASGLRAMLPSLRTVLSSLNFWLVALWFCIQFSLHISFGGLWAGTYLADVHGLDKTEAGNILNMMGVGLLLGAPFNGWLSDVVFGARKPVMLLCSLGGILLFAALLLLGGVFPAWLLYGWFLLLGVFGMGALAAGFATVRDMFGVMSTGTASGLLNTFPSFVAAALQTLSGYLLGLSGKSGEGFPPEAYNRVILLFLGLAALSLLAGLAVKEGSKCPNGRFRKNYLLEPQGIV